MSSEKQLAYILKDTKKRVEKIIKIIKKPKWGFDLPWQDFINGMYFLPSQSYGFKIQNRLGLQYGFEKVGAKEDKGDFKKGNEYYEFKVSLITDENKCLNLVQLRPWQGVDYYCFAFDTRSEDLTVYAFKLSHDQMEKEITAMKATSAHGTKTANKNNENVEYRISLYISEENPDFQRWVENYRVDFDMNARQIKSIKKKNKK